MVRHPKISRQTEYRIKTILKENNQQQGWTTKKQVEKMIIKESGIKYHHNYIYCILCRWGFKQKVPRKVHVNTASAEEKEISKKGPPDTCGYTTPKEKESFNIVSIDESFIFYDSLVRRVWIEDGKRPVVRVTGSHKHSCLFGAVDHGR